MGSLKNKLSVKFMVPAVLVVVLGIASFGWMVSRILESEVRKHADQQTAAQIENVLDSLQTADELSTQAVRSAMKVLIREGQRLGIPETKGQAKVGAETVPNLYLGNSSQTDNFALVDLIKGTTGATATLFVRRGDTFIRVSTNVLKSDGSRAVGTALDPNGRAFAAIRGGESFYGMVDILGKPYMTAYEPMRDRSGQVAGIWYVGFPLSTLADLGKRIGDMKILESGFIALLHKDGKIVFKGEHVSEKQIQRLLDSTTDEWVVVKKPFENWGYTLLAAYPQSDVTAKLHSMRIVILCSTLVVAVLLLAAQYWLIARLVVIPMQSCARFATAIAGNNLAVADLRVNSSDEVGEAMTAMNVMKANLHEVIQAIGTTAQKVAGAGEDLSHSSQQISANSEETSTQANVVSQATKQVNEHLRSVTTGANR